MSEKMYKLYKIMYKLHFIQKLKSLSGNLSFNISETR